jgi:hypothetical protein
VDAHSRCVVGPVRTALSPCQGVLLTEPLPQDKESWRLGACTGLILAGTPVRRRDVLGAHVLGHRRGSDPGRQVGGPPRVPGGRAPGFVVLGAKAPLRAAWRAVPLLPSEPAGLPFIRVGPVRDPGFTPPS